MEAAALGSRRDRAKMLKPFLIALAALTAFDAVATDGRYRTEVIAGVARTAHAIAAMGWSMTLS